MNFSTEDIGRRIYQVRVGSDAPAVRIDGSKIVGTVTAVRERSVQIEFADGHRRNFPLIEAQSFFAPEEA
jgi:exosome complex RNA-binding protein Csl4